MIWCCAVARYVLVLVVQGKHNNNEDNPVAHQITETDNLFMVREPAWHGLGKVLSEYPTLEEAKAMAHPWEPVTTALYEVDYAASMLGLDDDGVPATQYKEMTGWKRVERSDNGFTLGVVKDSYHLALNSDLYEIADALEKSAGDVQIETAGSLKGGAKVWLLVRLREGVKVPGDPSATLPYLALQNSHDGSASLRGQAVMTRIVCDNTAQWADLEAKRRGTEFRFRHTSGMRDRIEDAKNALEGWRENIGSFATLSAHLAAAPVRSDQVTAYLDQFIPLPASDHVVTDRVLANLERARSTWRGYWDGQANEGLADTRYKLLQTSIEYLNHGRRANTRERKFSRAYLDRDALTATAARLALAV